MRSRWEEGGGGGDDDATGGRKRFRRRLAERMTLVVGGDAGLEGAERIERVGEAKKAKRGIEERNGCLDGPVSDQVVQRFVNCKN